LIPVRAPKQAPFSGAITPKTPGSFTAKSNNLSDESHNLDVDLVGIRPNVAMDVTHHDRPVVGKLA
jgi:hypothetical protein